MPNVTLGATPTNDLSRASIILATWVPCPPQLSGSEAPVKGVLLIAIASTKFQPYATRQPLPR